MNAARTFRPARAVLAAALLCGIAACSREAEPQEGAAASAPPVAAKADYMTEHIARDAALSDALVGTWNELITDDDGTQLDAVVRYAADHTLTIVVAARNKPDDRYSGKGTWSVAQGFLAYQVTPVGTDKTLNGSDEVLRIDNAQLVYIDGDDKKTKIATRVADGALAAALATGPQAAPAPAPLPALAVAAPPPEDKPLVDETLFVATKDSESYAFRLTAPSSVFLVVELEERVPLNVIVLPGRVTSTDFTLAIGYYTYGQLVPVFQENKIKGVATLDDLFASRLSKRAAYGRFVSPRVTLDHGTYTVILDNSGEVSPTRGDAPVHLRLFSRPA